MKRSDENMKKGEKLKGKPKDQFLRSDDQRLDLEHEHKEYLGMEVPEGYFSRSKQRIMENLPFEKEQKKQVFRLTRSLIYPLAASILLLVSLSVWFFNGPKVDAPGREKAPVAKSLPDMEDTGDFLLTSLLVDENQIDSYVDEVVLKEVVVKAELSEQQLENMFLNSLIEDDSVVDEYLEDHLLKEIVL
jgi:hypothetical protein